MVLCVTLDLITSYVTLKKTNTNICKCVQSVNKKKKRIKIKVTMGEKKINNSINPLGGQRESL